jgi:osmotically-inducible protein OsmY
VKIITRNGVVVLRGPVKTDGEKTLIASIASKTAGVSSVDDQLEVERDD